MKKIKEIKQKILEISKKFRNFLLNIPYCSKNVTAIFKNFIKQVSFLKNSNIHDFLTINFSKRVSENILFTICCLNNL